MFFSKKEPGTPVAEIFTGITSSTINDIHAYLDNTFGIVAEEKVDGGSTEFFIDGIATDRIQEAVAEIQGIVGEKFEAENVMTSNQEEEIHTIIITSK